METRDKERIEKWANEIECIPEGECKPGNHCFDCPCAAYTEGLQAGAEYERTIADQQLAEKDKEIQKLSDAYGGVLHAYNESRIIKEEKNKEIASLKEALRKARSFVGNSETHTLSDEKTVSTFIEEIENLLK